jgi:hypothetical protein
LAVRIVLKRSSIPNKRPNADILDPGELALNTNALTPGLFFEADNNSVIKVGPTAVGLTPPTLLPSLGEMFFDEGDGTLKVGSLDLETANAVWKDVSGPYLGGTDGFVVFVAPEFPNSSDGIANDGQAVPFKTLNRAVIEVAKSSIEQLNENDAGRNARYVIYVSPSIVPVYNGPGLPIATDDNDPSLPEFNVNFEKDVPDLPNPLNLQEFNPESGGLLLPRGTSVIGMDLRKVQLRPTYVPTSQNPTTLLGETQPKSAILKWTGNSIVDTLSFRDKRSDVTVTNFGSGPASEGEFISARPHCFGFNDRVFLKYAPGADQRTPTGGSSAVESFYYVYPTGVNSFYLSFTNMVTNEANYIERSQLPQTPQNVGYLASCLWDPYSHNRLTALFPATQTELDTFYQKVQLAFPVTFGGKSNQAEVINPGETQLVAPVGTGGDLSLLSNSTDNSSPYCNQISLRSNYGLCGLEHDGNLVTGFKSAIASNFTVCSLQLDPAAYEIYTTVQNPVTLDQLTGWYPLGYAAWATLPPATRPPEPSFVPRADQLALLNNTGIVNIRYYYKDYTDPEGLSYGLSNPEKDFRHFGVKASNNAYIQVDSSWSIGTAIGFWTTGGARMTATNCSSNFTQIALRSEGFAGIGTLGLGTVDPQDSGFVIAGIRMPQKVMAEDTQNISFYDLGPNILIVRNVSSEVQEIVIGPGFQPINIQPFSLAPNTLLYSRTEAGLLSAKFIDDGLPTVIVQDDGSCILRMRRIDSSFTTGVITNRPEMENWSPPFIRRWNDPRNLSDAAYSLILENTSPSHRDPLVGNILRLNQENQNTVKFLRPGVQFDPAQTGGWGRIFQVAFSETEYRGNAPQLNEVIINRGVSNRYYTAFNLCDTARPWEPDYDNAHGVYVTNNDRNWYAAANDFWNEVYFSNKLEPTGLLKLEPNEFNSPWAISAASEILSPVETTYQGLYSPDPRKDEYKTGYYMRGDSPLVVNYGFELYYNEDNGSPSLGLLDYKVNVGPASPSTQEIIPEQTVITVESVEDFPNPFATFGVVSFSDPLDSTRIEYCELLAVDKDTNTITVLRGLYGTAQLEKWPINTPVTVQGPQAFVDPRKYDLDWAPSKESVTRFLQVMGYSDVFIGNLLTPKIESYRNQPIATLTERPANGYALATGAWPVEFATPSRIDSLSHSFHSAGRLLYSKGLPPYLKNEIPTKQYYDYLSTQIWAGILTLSGGDENGNLPTSGEITQTGTGRPYDTYTSAITDYTRTDPGGDGDSGGGGGGGGVSAVFTGTGLSGGPIFNSGTINLEPPTQAEIGGVKQGENILIDQDGVISVDPNGTVGTVTSITFGNGLNGGTITTSGSVSVKVGIGLEINGTTSAIDLVPAQVNKIGGVSPGTALSVTNLGVLSVKPPDNLTNTIGGVKQGSGVNITADGTLSVSSLISLLDNISPGFDGSQTDFTLTINGVPFRPTAPQNILVTVGGIIQSATLAYVTSGTTISFTSAPPAGSTFYGLAFNVSG